MFTTVARSSSSSPRSCTSAIGATTFTSKMRRNVVGRRSRRASGSGLAPSVLALFTSRPTVPSDAATRGELGAVRGVGDVADDADDGGARRQARRPRRRADRTGGRRSTRAQPRSASASASASPRPCEAPVTIATGPDRAGGRGVVAGGRCGHGSSSGSADVMNKLALVLMPTRRNSGASSVVRSSVGAVEQVSRRPHPGEVQARAAPACP